MHLGLGLAWGGMMANPAAPLAPPDPAFMLLESGGFLLLESGNKLLLG